MKPTRRSDLGRIPARGSHDWNTICEILDVGFLAHIGFSIGNQPFVIPTLYGREGEKLYVHGSSASRMLGELETGVSACITVTLVDGIVLSRSAFDHSMNYRSVVAFGIAKKIADPPKKLECLRIISEHLMPGRWADVRSPRPRELNATTVLEFSVDEVSSKIRRGPPSDDESDYGLPVWAGVLPFEVRGQPPIPDDRLLDGVMIPEYVRLYDVRTARRLSSTGPESI